MQPDARKQKKYNNVMLAHSLPPEYVYGKKEKDNGD